MAGLGVLLEGQETLPKSPQIISKTTILSSSRSPPPSPSLPTSSFLETCFLCGKRLSQGKDIYMYKGDRAFCSVECRCRQIAMDEESVWRVNCGGAASRRRGKAAGKARGAAGGFAY